MPHTTTRMVSKQRWVCCQGMLFIFAFIRLLDRRQLSKSLSAQLRVLPDTSDTVGGMSGRALDGPSLMDVFPAASKVSAIEFIPFRRDARQIPANLLVIFDNTYVVYGMQNIDCRHFNKTGFDRPESQATSQIANGDCDLEIKLSTI